MLTLLLDGELFLAPIGDHPQVRSRYNFQEDADLDRMSSMWEQEREFGLCILRFKKAT